jgi:hypothetical protein
MIILGVAVYLLVCVGSALLFGAMCEFGQR